MLKNVKDKSQLLDISKQLIRQERISSDLIEATLIIENKIYPVADCTSFGIAIFSEFVFPEKYEFKEALFVIDNVSTQHIHIILARLESLSDGRYKVAFSINGNPLDINIVMTSHFTSEALEDFKTNELLRQNIPRTFRHLTLEMKEFLQELKLILDGLELKLTTTSAAENRQSDEVAIAITSHFIEENLNPKLNELSNILTSLSQNIKNDCYLYFRNNVSCIINLAPFSNRGLNKPLGYAGDYEMMNMIYRNEPIGTSIFSKSLHKFMINMSGGKAVRNRAFFMKDKIKNHFLSKSNLSDFNGKTLSVASGPAREIQLLLEEQAKEENIKMDRIEFHFLDQDLSSLKYAQRELNTIANELKVNANFKFFNIDIKRIIVKGLQEKNYDIIYSAGLFDYFSDSIAVRTAQNLLESIKPGGLLIIGNFDVTNPSKTFMELAWDWPLTHRSSEELLRIFKGLGTKSWIESEPEKVNLFIVIQK